MSSYDEPSRFEYCHRVKFVAIVVHFSASQIPKALAHLKVLKPYSFNQFTVGLIFKGVIIYLTFFVALYASHNVA